MSHRDTRLAQRLDVCDAFVAQNVETRGDHMCRSQVRKILRVEGRNVGMGAIRVRR